MCKYSLCVWDIWASSCPALFQFNNLWYFGTGRPNPKAESPNFRKLKSPTCSLLREMEVKARLIAGTKPQVEIRRVRTCRWICYTRAWTQISCTGTQVKSGLLNLLNITRKCCLLMALMRICEPNSVAQKVTTTLNLDYSVENNLKDLSKVDCVG